MVRFCGHDWEKDFVGIVQSATDNLLLCSPYISRYGCEVVLANVIPKCRDSGQVTVLTDLSPVAICQGSSEPDAIRRIADEFQGVRVRHLPRLHAKVYIADSKSAIVTSGNLTAGGLKNNHEYGVQLSEPIAVSRILNDLTTYADLGAPVERDQLAQYTSIAHDLKSSYEKVRRGIAAEARRRFQGVVRRAEDELVRFRLAGGAMHTVFAHTILFLLRKFGRLTTVQLHSRIETIHPDLCDNRVDRIIDGKRFGKKWKHAVRTAQQQLKKRGMIMLEGEQRHATGGNEPNTKT